jgi:hypothetical protein
VYRPQIGSAVAAGLLLSLGKHADMAIDISFAEKKSCFYNNQAHEPLAFVNQRRFVKAVFRYQPSLRTEFNVHTLWMENPLNPVLSVRQDVGFQARCKFLGNTPTLDISWIGSFRLAGQTIVLQPNHDETRQNKFIITLSGPPKRKNGWSLGVISQNQTSFYSSRSSSLALLGNASTEMAGFRIKWGVILFYTDDFQSRMYLPILGLNNSKTVEYVYGKGVLLYASYDWKPRKWLTVSMQLRQRRIMEAEGANQLLRGTVALRFLRTGME